MTRRLGLPIVLAAGAMLGLVGCTPNPTDLWNKRSSPPATGASPSGGTPVPTEDAGTDPTVQHCLAQLNSYRAAAGAAPLQLDPPLSAFAAAGDQAFAAGGSPHAHFIQDVDAALGDGTFCNGAAENQGAWPAASVDAAVDGILAEMMAEGPGGGHHDNILDPNSARVGIALISSGGQVVLTNDFSPACP